MSEPVFSSSGDECIVCVRLFDPARQLFHRAVSGVFIGAGPVNGIGYIVFGYAVPGKLLSNLVGPARTYGGQDDMVLLLAAIRRPGDF